MELSNRDIFRILVITSLYVGLLLLAWLAHRELAWLGAAFFLAIALNPAVDHIARFMPKKKRGWAALIVLIVSLLILSLLAATLLPPLISQTQSLFKTLPDLVNQLQNSQSPAAEFVRRYDLLPQIQANQANVVRQLTGLSGSLLGILRGVFSGLVATLTVLALTAFMLLEGPRWMEGFWKLQPTVRRSHRQKLADQMYKAVTGYVTGNVLTSGLAAVATSVMLAIVGIPYAIPLGVTVGIFDLLPLIGATLGAVVVLIVCLFHSLTAAIIMLVFFLVYQQMENHILQPLVYSKTVQLSPLSVLVAALIGAQLAGILGALVAIPIAAGIQILVKDYIEQHQLTKR